MTVAPPADDQDVRARLAAARDHVRRERGQVMHEAGVSLRDWRVRDGVLQQDLAAESCVSATVVRRIERGDYESPPPQSLISAVSRRGGPAGLLQELGHAYQRLQAQQKHIDKLLNRKVVPAAAVRLLGQDETVSVVAGLGLAALPSPPAVFVGRERELAAFGQLLGHHKLVTLVGPGGIGKTALCLRFVATRPPSSAGPWFADLSAVRPGESLLTLLGRLILDEDADHGDDSAIGRFHAVLQDTPALIVLDNCEHILPAVAQAATELLNACSGLRIVATSREPLHLPDEAVLTVGPLPVTPALSTTTASASPRGDAAELFFRLLSKARGDQARLTPGEVAAAEELCRQLDGVPLSIELAAARARTLSVSDVATSARRGLAILSGGRQDIPRHRAIEATIRWSWDLLGPADREALSRLTIMSAPFTFQCGAQVAAEFMEDGDRAVASLADKSLLNQVIDDVGVGRLRLLGVVQNFAAARLSATNRIEAVRKLMAWALQVTQIDELALQQSDTIERLDRDFPLIRDALELSSDSPGDQVRLALAIWQYWGIRSLTAYGCQFLAKAYDDHISLDLMERGRALGALANLLQEQGDYSGAIAAAKRGIEIRRALGDPTQLRYGLLNLSSFLQECQNFDEAEQCLAEIAQLPGGDDAGHAGDLSVRQGREFLRKGDTGRALQLLHEAVECYDRAKLSYAQGAALAHLSIANRRAGRPREALREAQDAWEIAGTRFSPGLDAYISLCMAEANLALGKQDDALAALDATQFDHRISRATRAHSLAVRAMAASAVSPPAAATLLLAHLGEFQASSDSPEPTTLILVRAAHEAAYQAGHYEDAAHLLGAHAGLWPVEQIIEVGPPEPAVITRLDGHLSQSEMQERYESGLLMSQAAAFDFAAVTLNQIASRLAD